MTDLFITGAGVSKDSGIPTFRGEDGVWTIGSRHYTPQEMATRDMYLHDPGQFLLWYFKRFATYRNVQPNIVHDWLAAACNGDRARLITQNIDGLDGKAGNQDYVSIHGRLDKMTMLHDQAIFDQSPDPLGSPSAHSPFDHVPLIDAPWDEVIALAADMADDADDPDDQIVTKALLEVCKIPASGPEMGVSLKPYVLLFDEYYTALYRMAQAEEWMHSASKMVFMGTSFSVNITMIALRVALQRRIPIEIVNPEPVDIEAMFGIPEGVYPITYTPTTAQNWVADRG